MSSWVFQQQLFFSFLAILVLLGDQFLSKRLGSVFVYKLYLLIPVCLVLANLSASDTFNLEFEQATPTIQAVSSGYSNVTDSVSEVLNPVSEARSFDWIGTVWWSGFVFLLFILVISFLKVSFLPLAPRSGFSSEENCREKFFTSRKISSPILIGFVSPKIVLPENYGQIYSNRQLSLIFSHEEVHAKRYDNLWNLLALIVVITFWINPLAWVLLYRFRLFKECSCDEIVLANAVKSDRLEYAKTMVITNELKTDFGILQSHYGDKRTMITRIERMKNKFIPSKILNITTKGFCLLVGCLSIVWGQAVAGEKSSLQSLGTFSSLYRQPPRQAFFAGVQGEVLLQFNVAEDGEVSNIKALQVVTSGGFEDQFVENATFLVKNAAFQTKGKLVEDVKYIVRYHYAGVGTSAEARDEALKKMPKRDIKLLPYSIPDSEATHSFNIDQSLYAIKSHFPRYPSKELEMMGVSAEATVEFDVNSSGIPFNVRVIDLEVQDQYRDLFMEEAQQASELYVFSNQTSSTVEGVRVKLKWQPSIQIVQR
ncbi:M56 family metallopeptidase [Microbulbifer sp. PAAF003]|uniref:M56 family metallopeptidase n=1 Tax=Microbulbifer sp. PAAF003 TaxID=3243375 RepID=UPI004039FCB8